MARLLYNNSQERPEVTECGGVLVSFHYVLTAAHCIRDGGPDRVALGENDVSQDYDCLSEDCGELTGSRECLQAGMCADKAVIVEIAETTVHPDFSWSQNGFPQNDVALLKLKQYARFSTFIQPICLPPTNQVKPFPVAGENLLLSGWGSTETSIVNKAPSKILQFLSVTEVALSECSTAWQRNLSASILCVSSMQLGKSPCVGDSGGPVVRIADKIENKFELVGIISFGPNICGSVENPIGTTKIEGYILSWITDIVNKGLLFV